MGLHLPQRAAGNARRGRRTSLLAAVAGLAVVLLAGCSAESQGEWKRLAMPEPASAEGEHTLALWQGAWIAAWITGLIVWMLIFWVVVRYRRRNANEIPIQTRYNLPLEIFYTVAPIVMVVVFFSQTVRVQNIVLDDDVPADNIVEVVGQQWSWTFNYGVGGVNPEGDEEPADDLYPYERYVWTSGTASDIPTIVLPVGVTTKFNLHSPDVIHNFGVPAFLVKMDVLPGRVNHYQVTPTETGTFPGKCFELCGTYHSRMLFNVEVVTPEQYAAHLEELAEAGQISDEPLLGGENPDTQVGLTEEADELSEGAAE